MGALPEQVSEFGFGGSLAEKADSWLESSGFGTLHNCVQDKSGALEKHPGYSAYGTHFRNGDILGLGVPVPLMDLPGNVIGSAPKLLKRGDLVGAVSNGLLLAKTDEWVLQGRVSPWVCEQRTLCRADGVRFECCCSGNWSYTAFETASGGVRVAVTYVPSGETVAVFGGITTATEPRIVAIDGTGTALLFYIAAGSGHYAVVTPDGISAGGAVTLTTGYDVTSDIATKQLWIVYLSTAVLVKSDTYIFPSGVLLFFATMSQAAVNATACSISVDVTANRLVLAWVDYVDAGGGNSFLAIRALSRSTDYSATLWGARSVWEDSVAVPIGFVRVAYNLGVAFSPFDGHFFAFSINAFDGSGNIIGSNVIGRWVSLTGVAEGAAAGGGVGNIFAPFVHLRSRPVWDVAGQRMFMLADGGLETNLLPGRRGHVVLGIEPRSAAGKLAPTVEGFGVLGAFSYLTAGAVSRIQTSSPISGRIARPFQDATGVWHLQSFEIGGQAATQQLLCDYALHADDRVATFSELGKATYITGALLSQWDGVRVCEAAFLFDPIMRAPVLTAAGAMPVGSYVYAATYGRFTSTGEVVRSRPSLTASISVAAIGTQSVTLTAEMPGPSNLVKQDSDNIVYVEFWRSEVGTTSPLYFAGRAVCNTLDSSDVSFIDRAATHAGNEQLYSDGTNGEIANTPAPSPLSLCQWRNRLWATDGEQVFFTKEAAATRSAEWSQAFFVTTRGAPERLTVLAPLGEVLMAFAEDSTSYIYGDAPGANGDGSTLIGPMPAITELGCTQPAGIAQLPAGLLVPTRRGLHLLTGKREFEYIGASIEKTLAAFPRVRCARHIAGTNRVWVSLATADLTAGIAVLLDTNHKTFSTVFSGPEFFGVNMVHCSTIDANGAHTFSVQDGHTYDATPGNYLVDASHYAQVVETPWFKGNGPSGELRARRFLALMKNMGGSLLKIEIAYDYSDTYKYSITIDDVALAAMEGTPDTLQLRIPFPRQRCQSYRIRFTELSITASSAGFRFVALRMYTSLRPGSGKLLSQNNSPSSFVKSS